MTLAKSSRNRWGYAATTQELSEADAAAIIGELTMQSDFPVYEPQRQAWL